MKSVDTQKPLTEEIASPLMSDGKTISVLKCIEPGGPLNHVIPHTGIHHKLSKCQRPLKFHGNIFPAPFLEFRRKNEKFLLCLSQLFISLDFLEINLAELYTKPVIGARELAVLADKAAELKSVAREALAYFHEAAKAVEPPFQPSGNDFSESVEESQGDCGDNCDADSFNDVGPTNSSEHGGECI